MTFGSHQHRRQVAQPLGHMRMVRSVRCLRDHQGAATQRLGLRMAVCVAQQSRQAVQAYGHVRIVRPERCLKDRQGAAKQRLGLRMTVRDSE